MRWKSTPGRYGAVAILIHWITAFAVIGLLASGLAAANQPDDAAKTAILRVHAAIGATILLLTLLRIAWWALVDTKPDPVAGLPGWQERASRLAHLLLYALVIVMGASGIGMMILSGAGTILYGGAAGPLPDFTLYPPRAAHGAAAFALLLVAALHVAAALHHQFVRRDRLLARMGIGRPWPLCGKGPLLFSRFCRNAPALPVLCSPNESKEGEFACASSSREHSQVWTA